MYYIRSDNAQDLWYRSTGFESWLDKKNPDPYVSFRPQYFHANEGIILCDVWWQHDGRQISDNMAAVRSHSVASVLTSNINEGKKLKSCPLH